MQAWMKIWRFLDENDSVDSLMEIARSLKISYPSVIEGVKVLEDVGYVNVIGNRSKRSVIKTQKFVETRNNIFELWKRCNE